MESIREKLVVNILKRFLQGHDVPHACDSLLDGALFSSTGSWVPVVDAEPFVYRHVVVEMALLIRCNVSSGGCFAEFCVSLSNVDRVPFQDSFEIGFHPRSKTTPCERDVFLVPRISFLGGVRQPQAIGKGTMLLWVNIIAYASFGKQCCSRLFPKGGCTLGSRKLPSWRVRFSNCLPRRFRR